jgi:hypothetical protein
MKLRGALATIARVGLPSCACGDRMRPAELEDAARLAELTGDDSIFTGHPLYQDAAAAWTRQTLREISRPGNRMRCGGCRRYIPAANTHCGCGFVNDMRGRRNIGGYSAAPAPDPIPF